MGINYINLSKTVSHALRHEPWLYELELDNQGWVKISDLLSSLKTGRNSWKELTLEDIENMTVASDKKRYEIIGDRIRALYGHSIVSKLIKEKACPPEKLFHGTSQKTLTAIKKSGLLPMGRQYVHLSVNKEIAIQVGRRKDNHPVILTVDSKQAHESGCNFYIGNDLIWLADEVPFSFISAF